ncbi:UDP-3-O-acyl-N-acetylglucosamine deacetylase [Phenylobacterium sp.]|uniref:UDP-3-O-acyl-N-acetylglucosamine deacetylase n=1 Tax=Phenylobacterium sp. TaxID=1871053 RepID=UPI00286B87A5|nr:UDP-3-O-acyl-N-acetylglucosamine deacetylase [Phenylobacterium sp.]
MPADGFQSGAFQHTVKTPALFAGVGVHTGEFTRVAVRPAAPDTGIVFVRIDVDAHDNLVPCTPQSVCKTQLGTVITNPAGVTVATIEHLMAALVMSGIDNAVVELDGPEMPIMDGSSWPFLKILDRAGRRPQAAARRFIEILDTVEVVDGDKRATLRPAMRFEVAFAIEFPTAVIGRQEIDLPMDETAFRRELADCRTFGFLHEVEALRAMGLARGGTLENCVVIEGDRVLNPEGLRRPDEFVRHKALDAIGDLYVLGAPILGRFEGELAGHGINNQLVRALVARPDAWRIRTFADEIAIAV